MLMVWGSERAMAQAAVGDVAPIVSVADLAGKPVRIAVTAPNPNFGVNGDTHATLSTRHDYDIMGRQIHEWGENALPVEIVYLATPGGVVGDNDDAHGSSEFEASYLV